MPTVVLAGVACAVRELEIVDNVRAAATSRPNVVHLNLTGIVASKAPAADPAATIVPIEQLDPMPPEIRAPPPLELTVRRGCDCAVPAEAGLPPHANDPHRDHSPRSDKEHADYQSSKQVAIERWAEQEA